MKQDGPLVMSFTWTVKCSFRWMIAPVDASGGPESESTCTERVVSSQNCLGIIIYIFVLVCDDEQPLNQEKLSSRHFYFSQI